MDHRRSPVLSTRNALIGQSFDSLEALRFALVSQEELDELARDRSLTNDLVMAGFSFPLSSKVYSSTSITWFSIDEGVASGGLLASPSYEQTQIDTRLNFSDFLIERHQLSVGVRHVSQDSLDGWSAFVYSTFAPSTFWRISVRLRTDVRDYKNGNSQLNFAPSLNLSYLDGHHSLYLESGYYRYETSVPLIDDQRFQILTTYIGYQYQF